jgi:PAS domain S-box-containing protein
MNEVCDRTSEDVSAVQRLEKPLGESEDQLAFLLGLSDALRPLTDPVQIQVVAARKLGEHLGVDRCAYGEIDDAGQVVTVLRDYHAHSLPSVAGRYRIEAYGTATLEIIRRGDTFLVEDAQTDSRLADPDIQQAYAAMRVRSAVVMPLVKAGRFVALLTLQKNAPHVWSALELQIIADVADRTWAAVERALAETQLRTSEEQYRDALNSMAEGFALFDADLTILEVNPETSRLFGRSREDLVGHSFANWLSDNEDSPPGRMIKRVLRERVAVVAEHSYLRSDGKMIWLDARAYPTSHGRVGCLWRDITDRKHAEAALLESEARQRALIEGVPQLVWRASEPGDWTWASSQWTAFTGQSDQESRAWGWLQSLHPDDRERARLAWFDALEQGRYAADYRIRSHQTATYRWFQTRATPRWDATGAIVEWLGTSTDIDDLRRLKEEQDMLLAELQHRVRNILTVTRSIISRSDDEERDKADYIRHLDGRIAALARTQVMLTRNAGATLDLQELIRDELLAQVASDEQFMLDGPDVELSPKAAEVLTLAVHELATNATKYGAFSQAGGALKVSWAVDNFDGQPWLALDWVESGIAVVDPAPRRQGFGAELVSRRVPYELKGQGRFELLPGGLYSHIKFPLTKGASILQTDGVSQ